MKNTKEAHGYGLSIKNNPLAIEALKKERAFLLDTVQKLLKEGKEAEALFLASGQSQFTREALEIALN